MLCCLAILVASVFVSTLVLFAMEQYTTGILPGSQVLWRPLQSLVSFLTNSLLFSLIYRSLPKHPAPFKYCLGGGMLAALIWEIGRQILAAVLIGTRYTAAYGVIGSFIGLMLWCYYAVAVLLLGAEYIEVRWHEPHDAKNGPRGFSRNDSTPPAQGDKEPAPADPHHHVRTLAKLLAHPFPHLMS
jgi:membrane protein